MPGLRDNKPQAKHQIDGQGKDLSTKNGPADALDGRIAAAQLRTPPDGARGREIGLGGGVGSCALEGGADQDQVGAGAASTDATMKSPLRVFSTRPAPLPAS